MEMYKTDVEVELGIKRRQYAYRCDLSWIASYIQNRHETMKVS